MHMLAKNFWVVIKNLRKFRIESNLGVNYFTRWNFDYYFIFLNVIGSHNTWELIFTTAKHHWVFDLRMSHAHRLVMLNIFSPISFIFLTCSLFKPIGIYICRIMRFANTFCRIINLQKRDKHQK